MLVASSYPLREQRNNEPDSVFGSIWAEFAQPNVHFLSFEYLFNKCVDEDLGYRTFSGFIS